MISTQDLLQNTRPMPGLMVCATTKAAHNTMMRAKDAAAKSQVLLYLE
jgi:hypothetical protein